MLGSHPALVEPLWGVILNFEEILGHPRYVLPYRSSRDAFAYLPSRHPLVILALIQIICQKLSQKSTKQLQNSIIPNITPNYITEPEIKTIDSNI